MVDTYTINIVNKSVSTQSFWLFWQKPENIEVNTGVYANSSAQISIQSNQPGTNKFVIPGQCVVGAGAGNKPVGLNAKIYSSVTNNADLGDVWNVVYYDTPRNQGPTMGKDNATASPNMISIKTAPFDKAVSQNNGWYASQSFGIETENGFIGMTWSPDPNTTITLEPKLEFYVATGSYGANTMADWTEISNCAAQISAPRDFDGTRVCTVTYNSNGTFSVAQGA